MSKSKMDYARNLIQAQKYDEARKVLKTVSHPTAEEWLKKLDRIDPQNLTGQPKKSERRLLWIIGIFTLLLVAFSAAILFDPRAGGYNPSKSLPTVDIASTTLAITPSSIEINDVNKTGISEKFLEDASLNIAQHGYIDSYSAEMNADNRLITDLDIQLHPSYMKKTVAFDIIESLFRLYALKIEPINAGNISMRVFWEGHDYQCATGAGMGYKIMQAIDWQHITQIDLFDAIDKELYHDNAPTYGDIAWKPHAPTIDDCK